MKNKKLTLSNIKIQSFVTSIDDINKKTLAGMALNEFDAEMLTNNPLGKICKLYKLVQAVRSIPKLFCAQETFAANDINCLEKVNKELQKINTPILPCSGPNC